jgi:hypothetical protein
LHRLAPAADTIEYDEAPAVSSGRPSISLLDAFTDNLLGDQEEAVHPLDASDDESNLAHHLADELEAALEEDEEPEEEEASPQQQQQQRLSAGTHTDSSEERYLSAYHWVVDALGGHEKHGLAAITQRGPHAVRAFQLRNSTPMAWAFRAAVICHSLMVYVEERHFALTMALTAAVLAFYTLEIALKLCILLPQEFFSKRWNRILILFLLFFVADLICYANGLVQPFRLLRPWMLLTREREERRLVQALVSSAFLKPLLHLFLGIFLFILLFAAMGVHLFAPLYRSVCITDDQVAYQGAFDNVLIAFVHMFTLSASAPRQRRTAAL